MPIYEYRCERGHTFEVLQRMSEDPMTVCTSCEARVQRVLHPVAVHFKGSGFYTTDYGKKGRSAGDSADSGSNGSGSGDSSASKGEGKTDSKKPSTSGSKESSSSSKPGSSD